MNLAVLLSLSCIIFTIVLIACSRYQEWLKFLFAGMGFWLVLELVALGLRTWLEMSVLNAYASVFLLFLGLLTIIFAVKDHQTAKQASRMKCIEHTPVYENE